MRREPGDVTDDREALRATFDTVGAGAYADARPTYPDELVDALVAATGIGPGSRLLEVGCGPGTATLPLARLGCRITAVELGEGLAAEARRRLAAYPDVDVVTGSFESWPPGEHSFDLVYAATAWHWVDPDVRYRRPTTCSGRTGTSRSGAPTTCVPVGRRPVLRGDPGGLRRDRRGLAGGPRVRRTRRAARRRPPRSRRSGLFEVTRRAPRRLGDDATTPTAYLALLDTFSGHIAMEPAQRATVCTPRSAVASPCGPTACSGGTGARCCTWPPRLR